LPVPSLKLSRFKDEYVERNAAIMIYVIQKKY